MRQQGKGIIFDCDGVLIDSEELHRICYNKSFETHRLGIVIYSIVWNGFLSTLLGVEWDPVLYEKLQNSVGGGKEKLDWYFTKFGWPNTVSTEQEQRLLVKRLHEV